MGIGRRRPTTTPTHPTFKHRFVSPGRAILEPRSSIARMPDDAVKLGPGSAHQFWSRKKSPMDFDDQGGFQVDWRRAGWVLETGGTVPTAKKTRCQDRGSSANNQYDNFFYETACRLHEENGQS